MVWSGLNFPSLHFMQVQQLLIRHGITEVGALPDVMADDWRARVWVDVSFLALSPRLRCHIPSIARVAGRQVMVCRGAFLAQRMEY